MRQSIRFVAVVAVITTACGSPAANEVGQTVTTKPITAPSSTIPTTIPSATTVPPSSTTTTAAGIPKLTSGSFKVPFSTEVPTGSRFRKAVSADVALFQVASNDNAFLIVTTRGPDSVEDWSAAVQGQSITISDEPITAVIGGLTGSYLEFVVQDSLPAPGEFLFDLEPGDIGRVYGVRVGEEPVTLLAVASADLWPSFQEVIDALIASFVWK